MRKTEVIGDWGDIICSSDFAYGVGFRDIQSNMRKEGLFDRLYVLNFSILHAILIQCEPTDAPLCTEPHWNNLTNLIIIVQLGHPPKCDMVHGSSLKKPSKSTLFIYFCLVL